MYIYIAYVGYTGNEVWLYKYTKMVVISVCVPSTTFHNTGNY